MEAVKEEIKFYLTLGQFSTTGFVGFGVSLVSIVLRLMDGVSSKNFVKAGITFVIWIHVAILFLALSFAI